MITTSDYLVSLDKYIEKFVILVPTDISDKEILDLENVLNDIYRYQLDLSNSIDLENAIIEALSQVSEMSDKIKKKPNSLRDTSFFSSLKKLPRLLKVIKLYLDDQYNQLK